MKARPQLYQHCYIGTSFFLQNYASSDLEPDGSHSNPQETPKAANCPQSGRSSAVSGLCVEYQASHGSRRDRQRRSARPECAFSSWQTSDDGAVHASPRPSHRCLWSVLLARASFCFFLPKIKLCRRDRIRTTLLGFVILDGFTLLFAPRIPLGIQTVEVFSRHAPDINAHFILSARHLIPCSIAAATPVDGYLVCVDRAPAKDMNKGAVFSIDCNRRNAPFWITGVY